MTGRGDVLITIIHLVSPWLAVCYLAGLLVMLLQFSGGMWQLLSFRKFGVTPADKQVDNLLHVLKDKLYITSAVQLLVSTRAQVPMVVGFLKPIILMPATAMTQLSIAELEAIILHELAHIKRHDYLMNILQTIAETILFFNPFVWMISRIVRREREYSCDDLVLQHIPEPLSYATALRALATSAAPALAVAASGTSYQLFHRIKRIMEMKKHPFNYSKLVATLFVVVAITCTVIFVSPSFAGNTTEKLEETATTTKTVQPPSADDFAEEKQLIWRLSDAKLVDEINGFVVEKRKDELYINGKKQADDIARKYLSDIKKDEIRVQVMSFAERLKMHPEAGIMQNIMPMSFSSPCIQYKPKEGC
jgi:beta-lactamase regulating signal transducer with metallopeptidase domain